MFTAAAVGWFSFGGSLVTGAQGMGLICLITLNPCVAEIQNPLFHLRSHFPEPMLFQGLLWARRRVCPGGAEGHRTRVCGGQRGNNKRPQCVRLQLPLAWRLRRRRDCEKQERVLSLVEAVVQSGWSLG